MSSLNLFPATLVCCIKLNFSGGLGPNSLFWGFGSKNLAFIHIMTKNHNLEMVEGSFEAYW